MATKKCPNCGAEIPAEATRCYVCREWVQNINNTPVDNPPEFLATLLFAWFLGCFGIHRFYTGNIPIGIAQLLTLGGCGIWSYIDLVMICFNKFKDGKGRYFTDYNSNVGITVFVISLIPIGLILLLIFFIFLAIVIPGVVK